MSDFFSGLRNASNARPDAVFDQASIWPSASGPHGGYSGDPDGRINATSSLLDNVQPYAYGTGARLGSSAMGANVPHNVQKIVPELRLPESSTVAGDFTLPHAVSDGGVAFVLRYETIDSRGKAITHSSSYARQGLSRAVDHVVSLSALNYILAGLQERQSAHFAKQPEQRLNKMWDEYATQFGKTLQTTNPNPSPADKARAKYRLAETFVRDHARPFGVVLGSDKQGGQHQGSTSAVTYPVDFVITITVDGLNESLQNYWAGYDVNSGEELQYVLVKTPAGSLSYDLNAYKYSVRKLMRVQEAVWQLRPITGSQRHDSLLNNPKAFWMYNYWHFATSQKLHRRRLQNELTEQHGRYGSLAEFHTGALMQTNVSPEYYHLYDTKDPSKVADHLFISTGTAHFANPFSQQMTSMDEIAESARTAVDQSLQELTHIKQTPHFAVSSTISAVDDAKRARAAQPTPSAYNRSPASLSQNTPRKSGLLVAPVVEDAVEAERAGSPQTTQAAAANSINKSLHKSLQAGVNDVDMTAPVAANDMNAEAIPVGGKAVPLGMTQSASVSGKLLSSGNLTVKKRAAFRVGQTKEKQ